MIMCVLLCYPLFLFICRSYYQQGVLFLVIHRPGPVFTKGLSQGLGLNMRLLSQVSVQNLLKVLS